MVKITANCLTLSRSKCNVKQNPLHCGYFLLSLYISLIMLGMWNRFLSYHLLEDAGKVLAEEMIVVALPLAFLFTMLRRQTTLSATQSVLTVIFCFLFAFLGATIMTMHEEAAFIKDKLPLTEGFASEGGVLDDSGDGQITICPRTWPNDCSDYGLRKTADGCQFIWVLD